MGVVVQVNLGAIRGVQRGFTPSAPLMLRVHRVQAVVYSEAMRRRFDRLSKSGGGGEWSPLAVSTVLGRRSGRGGTIGSQLSRASRAIGRARTAQGRMRAVGRLKAGLASMGRVAILRDTDTLFRGLSIGDPGNRLSNVPRGLEYGFQGPAGRFGKGGMTLRRLASIHHYGARIKGGYIPARPILVQPDAQTVAQMSSASGRVVRAFLRGQ